MRLSKALLHIGTPKTGTTSFQEWAWSNRARLQGESGVRVYEGLFGANHYEFGLLCKRDSRNGFGELEFPDYCLPEWRSAARTHIRSQIEAAAADGVDLLVSSEVMSLLRHDDELERLRGLLEGLDVEAVAVIREPASFLKSWRRQIGPGGWSAHRSSVGYTEPDSWLVDYASMERCFARAFGGGRVTLLSYERALEEDGSVIPSLACSMGLGTSSSGKQGEVPWLNSSEQKPAENALPPGKDPREEIARLCRRISALSAENGGLKTQLCMNERERMRLQGEAARQQQRADAFELSLRQARDEIELANREREKASSVIEAMDSSASWRFTRPAREIKGALRVTVSRIDSRAVAVESAAALATAAALAAVMLFV